MNGNTYFNLRFYNPLPVQFAAADSEAHVTSGVTRRQSRIYFVDCKGTFTPHTSYLVTKIYPFYTKSRAFRGLKKDPFFHEIRKAGTAPSVPESPTIPPPPPPPRAACIANYVVNDAWRACITFAIWRQFLRKMNAARHNTRTLSLLN